MIKTCPFYLKFLNDFQLIHQVQMARRPTTRGLGKVTVQICYYAEQGLKEHSDVHVKT